MSYQPCIIIVTIINISLYCIATLVVAFLYPTSCTLLMIQWLSRWWNQARAGCCAGCATGTGLKKIYTSIGLLWMDLLLGKKLGRLGHVLHSIDHEASWWVNIPPFQSTIVASIWSIDHSSSPLVFLPPFFMRCWNHAARRAPDN
jgi:hypothetical protein